MFSNLGSNVTVLEYGNVMMPREDREVAELAIQDLRNKGISVYTNVETTAFSNEEMRRLFTQIKVTLSQMRHY